MPLRPYQQKTVNAVRGAIRPRANVCVQSPTGSGKTVMMADLLGDPVPQLLITHRRVLLDQLSAALTAAGVRHGIRAAGHAPNHDAPVQLAMIQTDFARSIKGDRWALHNDCRRIHVDEAHDVKGRMAKTLLDAYPCASVIGWTATPRQIGHIYNRLIVAATVQDLIAARHLVPPVVFTPDGPSIERLERLKRNSGGDFSPGDVDKTMRPKIIIGRVVEHYRRLNASGRPAVLFAPGVRQSLWFAQQLTAKGIPAAHIDARHIWMAGEAKSVDSTPKHRAELFARMRDGRIRVVCNRFVLREGWDFPALGHVILATAFGSRTSFVQACGRGLRPADGKTDCIFQDHGANFWRFPALESDTPWDMDEPERHAASTLADKRRKGLATEPIVCPKCDCLRVTGSECPNCGHRCEMGSRMVLQMSGRLVRVEGGIYRPRKTTARPGDDKQWARSFWAARNHRPQASLRQVYAWHAKRNGWASPPLDLPLMPKDGDEHLWNVRVGELDLSQLR